MINAVSLSLAVYNPFFLCGSLINTILYKRLFEITLDLSTLSSYVEPLRLLGNNYASIIRACIHKCSVFVSRLFVKILWQLTMAVSLIIDLTINNQIYIIKSLSSWYNTKS